MLSLPEGLRRCLLSRCEAVMRRPPDMIIGGGERPYMLRWHLLRSRWFGLYIHRFLRPDDDRALHDHPWPSLSLLLDGAVIEIYAPDPDRAADEAQQRMRTLPVGSIVWRGPRFAHRLSLFLVPGVRDLKGADVCMPAVTLFFVGPRVREWGFWCAKDSPAGGWRPWRKFVAADDPGAVGPGCE